MSDPDDKELGPALRGEDGQRLKKAPGPRPYAGVPIINQVDEIAKHMKRLGLSGDKKQPEGAAHTSSIYDTISRSAHAFLIVRRKNGVSGFKHCVVCTAEIIADFRRYTCSDRCFAGTSVKAMDEVKRIYLQRAKAGDIIDEP